MFFDVYFPSPFSFFLQRFFFPLIFSFFSSGNAAATPISPSKMSSGLSNSQTLAVLIALFGDHSFFCATLGNRFKDPVLLLCFLPFKSACIPRITVIYIRGKAGTLKRQLACLRHLSAFEALAVNENELGYPVPRQHHTHHTHTDCWLLPARHGNPTE
jgi:hypothetical protein